MSTTKIQNRFGIGYPRAAKVMDMLSDKGMIEKVMGNVGKLFNGFGKTIGVIKRQAVVKKGEIKQVISKIPKLFKKGSKVKKKEKIKEKKGKRRKTGKGVNDSDEENDGN